MATRDSLANVFQLSGLIERLTPRPGQARVQLRRPDDHLVLDLLFDNLRVDTTRERPALLREDANRRGVLIVEFPPQSFGEQTFHKASNQDGDLSKELPATAATGPKPTIAKSTPAAFPKPPLVPELPPLPAAFVRMSGPSRLAFTMPDDVESIPFTAAAVLAAVRDWPMRLDVNARPDQGGFMTQSERTFEMLRDGVTAMLTDEECTDVSRVLISGARRIAERAAGALTRSRRTAAAETMWQSTLKESEALFERHPSLRDGDRHTATLAAFAAGAAAELAKAADASGAIGDSEFIARQAPYTSLISGTPHEPSPLSTALELPYRLFISPIGDTCWDHALEPLTRHGRTELWQTRLVKCEPAPGEKAAGDVRAIWSRDMDPAPNVARPFFMPLDAQDRQFLVRLTSDWTQRSADIRFRYRPLPAIARRLHLSSLGALFDASGEWDPRPENVDLAQWRHLATLGRDQYVRVVYAGFLMPFGHAASLVKVTERTFEWNTDDGRVAPLRTRFFIIVRERTRSYATRRPLHRFSGLNFPFSHVEVLTQVTPDLRAPEPVTLESPPNENSADPPDDKPESIPLITPRMLFWPELPPGGAGRDPNFRFEVVATDISGRRVAFSLPMLFVSEAVNAKRSVDLRYTYSEAAAERRTANIGGDAITYDQSAGANPDDSRLSTLELRFATRGSFPFDHVNAVRRKGLPLEANFFPEVDHTAVNVPALQKLLGRDEPAAMTYPKVATAAAFANPAGVYLWAEKAQKLGFGGGAGNAQTDALGGLAAPEMQIVALSRLTGPVSGNEGASLEPHPAGKVPAALDNVFKNVFDPAEFFKGAKLLGGIDLAGIISVATGAGLGEAPKFQSSEVGDNIVTTFDWKTDVKSNGGLLIANADRKSGSRLTMNGEVVTPKKDASAMTRQASATLTNFKLDLFGCIILGFERLAFEVRPGQKPDVTVQLQAGEEGVKFGGALTFVNELRKYIPSNGFSDLPALSVTPSGIAASYSLGLPTMPLGIFSLSNVSLGAGFTLPFDNRSVSLRFSFCERQRPFSLIVSGLGGGGFAALTVGAGGVQEIEAALEFGAAVAINLGVASGAVEIKAGIYFNWKDDSGGGAESNLVIVAGYVRIHGELTVLALVSASLTFNLQLGYQKSSAGGLVFGEAELIVEIEVLFLSRDVKVRCRREFTGAPGDPKFIDLIPDSSIWDEYCGAFASEGP